MRILYVSSSYVPSRRASSVHVMKMCAALARQGHRVTLLTKGVDSGAGIHVDDPFAFYGVQPGFSIVPLRRPPQRGGGLIYAVDVYRYLRRNRETISLAYGRDIVGCWFATRLGIPTILELHEPPPGILLHHIVVRSVMAKAFRHLVAISRALLEELRGSIQGLSAECSMVCPDAADPCSTPTSPPARGRQLRVGYAGQLYPGKGLEMITPLAEALSRFEFHVVGGNDEHLQRLAGLQLPSNLTLHGFNPPGSLPSFYEQMDVLLMPYQARVRAATGKSDIGRWMSPLKMFEYMASGKAIVSSDLPVLREVLSSGRNALLVPPDDLDAWIAAINRLAENPDLRRDLGARARKELETTYTWDLRARHALSGPLETA